MIYIIAAICAIWYMFFNVSCIDGLDAVSQYTSEQISRSAEGSAYIAAMNRLSNIKKDWIERPVAKKDLGGLMANAKLVNDAQKDAGDKQMILLKALATHYKKIYLINI
jgi:hypothetical protein